LPAGVTFNSSTAKFEGTPTAAGESNFTVTVTSDIGSVTSGSFLLRITKGALAAPGSAAAAAVSGSALSITATYTLPANATSVTAKLFDAATGGNQVGSTVINFSSGGSFTGLVGSTTYYVELTAIGDANWADTVGTRVAVTTNAAARAPTFTVDTNVSGSTDATIYRTTGQSVTFSVTAASPDGGSLAYQWLKDGAAISGQTSSTLALTNLTTADAAAYSVAVTATYNGTTATATSSGQTLTVAGSLSLTTPLTGLSGTYGTAFTALTITATGGRRDASSSCSITTGALPSGLSIALSGTNCQITGTPTAVGSFDVVATITDTNGATASTGSFTIVISDVAPGQPTIGTITVTSQQLSVAFTAGTNNGSVIVKYQYSTNGGSSWSDRTDGGTTATPIVITKLSTDGTTLLTNGTSYNIQIRAVNNTSGTATASTAATPLGIASAPTISSITPSDKQLSVAFTAGATNGATVTKFQYSTDGGGSWSNRTDTGTTASPLVITKLSTDGTTLLTNGASYSIQIRAFSTDAGIASGTTSATPAAVPSAPTVTATSNENQQSVLSWSGASDNGSVITGYTVTATYSGGAVTVPAGCTSLGATTGCTFTGLTNGSTYTFSVRATNAIGTGSAGTATGKPASTPSAPQTFTASSNSLKNLRYKSADL
jgi:hypothetical protein